MKKYRMLKIGEVIQLGDELSVYKNQWEKCYNTIGNTVGDFGVKFRRPRPTKHSHPRTKLFK